MGESGGRLCLCQVKNINLLLCTGWRSLMPRPKRGQRNGGTLHAALSRFLGEKSMAAIKLTTATSTMDAPGGTEK